MFVVLHMFQCKPVLLFTPANALTPPLLPSQTPANGALPQAPMSTGPRRVLANDTTLLPKVLLKTNTPEWQKSATVCYMLSEHVDSLL